MEFPLPQSIFAGGPEVRPGSDEEYSCRFEDLTIEDLQLLAEETIARCNGLFDQILDSNELTYDSVIAPHTEIDDTLQQVLNFLSMLSMLHTDPDIRQAASETLMIILRDSSYYLYNFDGNKKVRAYQQTKEAKKLKGEQRHYLKCTLHWLEESGHGLSRSRRKKIKRFNACLQEFEEEFLQNISEDTTVVVLSEAETAGLDEHDKSVFLVDAGNGQYELELVESTYSGFMSSASDREARRVAYTAYNSRAKEANTRLLQKAVHARQKIAGFLDYESWIQLAGSYNMVRTTKEISNLYDSIVPGLTAKAQQEIAVMEEMLASDGYSGPLQAYDLEYYEAKLFKERYDIDLDKVREYLPLPAVLAGAFDLAGKLFGVNIRAQETEVWHDDVLCFAVDDARSDQQIGTMYMDLYARDGKYKHCCCQPLVGGRAMPDGTYRQPTSLVIANLTPPLAGEPALLNQSQRVDIAFHEVGHALHDILTKAKLPAFAGLATAVDFVEIPSQIMENWAWNAEILQKYARHYKTGEPMPDNMIEALIDSKNLNVGIKYLQYVSKGLFDLYLHSSLEPVDVEECWRRATAVLPFPHVEGTFYPAAFDHVMSSYAGAYYSYIYDEVFSSDMFRRFQEEGLFSSETGQDYRRKILEPGASKDEARMVRNFLGRKVDSGIFLRNLGIVAPADT